MQCFNYSLVRIKKDGATKAIVKIQGQQPIVVNLTSGEAIVNTNNWQAGEYFLQWMNADQVLSIESLVVKQNLQYADEDFDPRSPAKIALDAINAFMEGRATAIQRSIKVGDKEIEYSSFEQLLKWKIYYEKQVRKQSGKKPCLRYEKIVYL